MLCYRLLSCSVKPCLIHFISVQVNSVDLHPTNTLVVTGTTDGKIIHVLIPTVDDLHLTKKFNRNFVSCPV